MTNQPHPLPNNRHGSFVLFLVLLVQFARADDQAAPAPIEWGRWKELGQIWVGRELLTIGDLSADESLILAVSEMENSVRVYDRQSEQLLLNMPIPQHKPFDPLDATFWPVGGDNPKLLVGTKQGLFLYHARTGERVAKLSDEPVTRMRWSPRRDILVCNDQKIPAQESILTFYRVSNGALEKFKTLPFANRVDEWDLDDSGRTLVALFYPADTLSLLDTQTGETAWTVAAPRFASTVDLSPDGARIAVGGEAFVLLDAKKPARALRYGKFANNIHRVRFAPAGDAVAVASYDGHIRILSADLEKPAVELLADLRHAGTANVYALVFYAGGKRLLSTSGDRTIRFWGAPKP
jgi:WD40 repeat protein